MSQFTAFLKGINLGKRRIKMEDLRASFAKMGLARAQTLIASGNVLFEAEMAEGLAERIEAGLAADFGFEVPCIIRTIDRLAELIASDPFEGVIADKDTRLFVYLFGDTIASNPVSPVNVPGEYRVTLVTDEEIFAIGWRKPNGHFSEGMQEITAPLGKIRRITNRNWNTILKMVDMARR